MGANDVILHHPDCDKNTIRKWVADTASEHAHEHGSSYSGYWNMKPGGVNFVERIFESPDEASTWISDNNDKHDCVHAVRAKYLAPLTNDELGPAHRELVEKLQQINNPIWNFNRKVRQDAMALKSKLVTCGTCGSKINVAAYLKNCHGVDCPVCRGQLLRKPIHDKQFARLEIQRDKAQADVKKHEQKARKKLKKDTPVLIWVVGGACAS